MFSWETVTEVAGNSDRAITDNFTRGALFAALGDVELARWAEVLADAIVFTVGRYAHEAEPILAELAQRLEERIPEAEAIMAKRRERLDRADQLLREAGLSDRQRQDVELAYGE